VPNSTPSSATATATKSTPNSTPNSAPNSTPGSAPMSKSITFTIAGTPVAQGNHRASQTGRIYETTKGHAAWRMAVKLAAVEATNAVDFSGAVVLILTFRFHRPPSHLKKNGELRKGYSHAKVTKPDLSKCLRAVEDSLTDAGIWRDDSYVTRIAAVKEYHANPGVVITIVEIEEPES